MALNKQGKTQVVTVLIYLVIIGGLAYLFNFGGFKNTINGYLGSNIPATTGGIQTNPGVTVTDSSQCPTDGQTTFTINVQDALATTATSVYPQYLVFNGNGLVKDGTLSSSATTFTVSCGKDYEMYLYNETTGNGNSWYPTQLNLQARIAAQPVNTQMTKVGDSKVNKVFNQAEGASATWYNNMSLLANGQGNWGIQFSANHTARGFNMPILICYVNSTEIKSNGVTLNSFSDGTNPQPTEVPSRIVKKTGMDYYAWEYPKMLTPTMSVITGLGSITASSTGPTATAASNMTCFMSDQSAWKVALYGSATDINNAVKIGPQNDETRADVGSRDSSESTLYFTNGEGL